MVWVQVLESPRLPARPPSEQASGSARGDDRGVRRVASVCASPERTRKIAGARLPRDGASPGGGQVVVHDVATKTKLLAADDGASFGATRSPSSGRPSPMSFTHGGSESWRSSGGPAAQSAARTWSGATSTSRSISCTTGASSLRGQRARQLDRNRASVAAKQRRLDALREQDQTRIAGIVERRKELREERFERLLDEVSRGDVPAQVGLEIREFDARQEERRRSLYEAWGANVYEASQAELCEHLTPPDRKAQQQPTGSKTVAFMDPNIRFTLRDRSAVDPTKRQIVEHAKEETFDRECAAVLGWSASSRLRDPLSRSLPGFRDTWAPGVEVAKATSRPVLEPTEWGQLKLQGLPMGRFAQVCEHGPGFRTSKRGAAEASFAVSEQDGVPAAGKQTVRVGPRAVAHGDHGVLGGRIAGPAGEAIRYKTSMGASSIAPGQDHYTYQTGPAITEMEFPLGKRPFQQWP